MSTGRHSPSASRRGVLLGAVAAGLLVPGCWTYPPGARRLATLTDNYAKWPYDTVLSGDGQRYLIVGPGARMQVLAIAPWQELATIELDATAINVASLDHDGGRVACSPWRESGAHLPTIEIWSTERGERIAKLPAPGREVVALEFSADNNHLLVVSSGGHVRRWDTRTWKRTLALGPRAPVRMASAISEHGDWIVTAQQTGGVSHLHSWRRSGPDRGWVCLAKDLPGQVLGLSIVGGRLGVAMDASFDPGAPGGYVWSRDGQRRSLSFPVANVELGPHLTAIALGADGHSLLAVGGHSCGLRARQLWTSTNDGPLRELARGPSAPRTAVIRADGRLVTAGGGVAVWDQQGDIELLLDSSGARMDPNGIILC